MRASISSVVKVASLAGLFWVDDSSEFVTWETAIETDSNADESSVKELETFWFVIEESKDAGSEPGVLIGDGVKRFGVKGKIT